MDIEQLQREVGIWTRKNFGDAPSIRALVKVMEELGELAGGYIGRIEHRKGKPPADCESKVKDAVADVLIALCVFCERENIDLNEMVERVWTEVSQRVFE